MPRHRWHVRCGGSMRAAAQDPEAAIPTCGHCGIARERGDGKFRNDDEAPAFRPRSPQWHPRSAAWCEGLHVQCHRARRTKRILRELCARARLVAGAVRGSRQDLRPRANRLQDQTVSERRPRPYGNRCGPRTAHHGAPVRDRGRRGRDHQIRIAPVYDDLSAIDRECQVQRSLSRRIYAGPRRAVGCRIHRGGAARRGGAHLCTQGVRGDLSGTRGSARRIARQGDVDAERRKEDREIEILPDRRGPLP